MTDELDRRRQIIEAAFRVFSRKGFKGATNREIAKQAGITPGLIYWYFPTKQALFQETLYAKSPVLPLVRLTEEMLDAPPREFFHGVATMILERMYQPEMTTALRFLLAETLRSAPMRKLWRERVVSRGLRAVAGYIEHQIERGTIRRVHPLLAARLFMGLLMSQGILSRLFELKPPVPVSELVNELVETYLHGVLATPGEPAVGPGRAKHQSGGAGSATLKPIRTKV